MCYMFHFELAILSGIEKWLKIMAADQERELEGELYLEIGRYICGSRDFLKLKIVKARLVSLSICTGLIFGCLGSTM